MTTRLKRLLIVGFIVVAGFGMASAGFAQAPQPIMPSGIKTEKLTPNQQMGAVYAEHLATSVCKSEYINKFKTSRLSPAEKVQLNAHTSSACKCLYTAAAQKSSPDMVLDYVMNIYGAQKDPSKPSSDVIAYYNSIGFRTVSSVYGNKAVRQKCGFIN